MGETDFRGEGVVILAWSFTALSTLFTFGRFYIHFLKKKRFIWDDVFNGLALLCLVTFCSIYQHYGPQKYNHQLNKAALPKKPKYSEKQFTAENNAAIILFWCVIYSTKASFLALYWMLFEVSRRFRIAWWVIAVYTALSFVATVLWSPILVCAERTWTQPCHKKCLVDMQVGWAALDIFGDILLMVLPLVMLQPLRMRLTQKIGLGIVFGLVIVNMVLEIIRALLVIVVDLHRFQGVGDICFIMQATLAVITCALPCYRSLLIRDKKKISDWSLPDIVIGSAVEKDQISV